LGGIVGGFWVGVGLTVEAGEVPLGLAEPGVVAGAGEIALVLAGFGLAGRPGATR
jgi:hypothetical protein